MEKTFSDFGEVIVESATLERVEQYDPGWIDVRMDPRNDRQLPYPYLAHAIKLTRMTRRPSRRTANRDGAVVLRPDLDSLLYIRTINLEDRLMSAVFLPIEVGTPITQCHSHRSRRAELPHRAPRRTRSQSNVSVWLIID